jgi:hydroxymethylglutaryl-CoA lyase
VCQVAEEMLKIGCFEISLGDTIGVGNPKTINQLLTELKKVDSDMNKYAIHCHDTYGLALANIYESLENGIKVIDSSCAGLGGLKLNLKNLFFN